MVKQLGLTVNTTFKKFLVHFYTEAIAGLLISEFKYREDHNPQKVVEYFSLILKSSLPEVLKSAEIDTAVRDSL